MKLKGHKIILRELGESDAESLQLNANDEMITKFTRIPYPYTLEHAKDFIKDTHKHLRNKEAYEFGIELDGKIIGMMSLMKIDRSDMVAEIGYWVGQKYWRKGYATEALNLILDFAFEKIHLFKVYANVMEPNTASKNLLEKTGFKKEGILRKQIRKNGKRYDAIRYGLLRSEHA